MSRTWELEDVEEAARASATFFIPSAEERRSLPVGKLVRLHFVVLGRKEGEPRAERMWVEVETARGGGMAGARGAERMGGVGAPAGGEGRYLGYLTNRPSVIEGLAPGDLIEFAAQHVARVYIEKDDPSWFANAERAALVSESVFEDCCRWLFQEAPDREDDSGWRLFAGTETPEQLEDVGRIRVCNVGWLCDFDPTLRELLRREDRVAFERPGRDAPWRRVEDWVPPVD